MIRRATADDVAEIVAIFEPSFALFELRPETSHAKDGWKIATISATSSAVARRIITVGYGDAEP